MADDPAAGRADGLRVSALDTLTGERKLELEVKVSANAVSFTIAHAHHTIYYELPAGVAVGREGAVAGARALIRRRPSGVAMA